MADILASDRDTPMTDDSTSRETRNRRKARQACRDGIHRYGSGSDVGGGILRRLCGVCGAVSIDLTPSDEPLVGSLFQARGRLGLDADG